MARPTPPARPDGLVVAEGYVPGALAAVIGLHMDYYGPRWGFGLPFEAKVAGEMAAFLERLEPARDLFLVARDGDGRVLGSISVDGAVSGTEAAHLRWFIIGDACRGTGLGRRLLDQAVAFCDRRGVARSYLTTFAGLDAARHLYESVGFTLVSTSAVDQWGGGVREQRFERPGPLSDTPEHRPGRGSPG
ncbi:GNAT family N-acetyltransferase [Roseospira visakhapatnamensis]|uniref:GNAT superfamily N-acetyltransferase n=1 Tax=Roseospira visakhapatnamensis TaxID=390880 RepID=A0A7W6WAG3_9PROT|nr:GNAT family N-acetyltransferase [Roseospira visakhapatnamensis]MBB4266462.1 GNAT superfamily N-acetyltransferase [Roseospira visakhapatnamensis]